MGTDDPASANGSMLLAVLAGVDARADTRQAHFVVQVTVPARATIAAVEQPTRLDVSQEDVDRGYLEVSARYVVESNAPQGWLLSLAPRVGLTREVEVRGRPVHDRGLHVGCRLHGIFR